MRTRALVFSAGVLFSSHLIEWYGVSSGRLFGPYQYGLILQPQIAGVPMAMGFAWLLMIWSSAALAEQLLPAARRFNGWFFVLVTALLMVVFDCVMEPAAMKLGYWTWQDNQVPLQNYGAWLLFSLGYALAGWRLNVLRVQLPSELIHLYIAQLVYFLLVLI